MEDGGSSWRLEVEKWFEYEVGSREMVRVGGWRARGNKVEVGGVNEEEA